MKTCSTIRASCSPGFGIVNAYASFSTQNERWDFALFGTNLTDERYRLSGNSSVGFGLAESIARGAPRVGRHAADTGSLEALQQPQSRASQVENSSIQCAEAVPG